MSYIDPKTNELLNSACKDGEYVLWTGSPSSNIGISKSDIFAIPFGLLWTGFSSYAVYKAWSDEAPFAVVIFGSFFVLVGLYLVIGRFFFKIISSSKLVYAITNKRFLTLRGKRVGSVDFSNISEVKIKESDVYKGTIYLKTNKGSNRKLEDIDNPRIAYDILKSYLGNSNNDW